MSFRQGYQCPYHVERATGLRPDYCGFNRIGFTLKNGPKARRKMLRLIRRIFAGHEIELSKQWSRSPVRTRVDVTIRSVASVNSAAKTPEASRLC